jgi:hypothetical protein
VQGARKQQTTHGVTQAKCTLGFSNFKFHYHLLIATISTHRKMNVREERTESGGVDSSRRTEIEIDGKWQRQHRRRKDAGAAFFCVVQYLITTGPSIINHHIPLKHEERVIDSLFVQIP